MAETHTPRLEQRSPMTGPDQHLIPGTVESDIVKVLYSNPDNAFTAAEISDLTDLNREPIEDGTAHLVELRLIEKINDNQYQALDREELRRYIASLNQLDRMFNQPDSTSDQ